MQRDVFQFFLETLPGKLLVGMDRCNERRPNLAGSDFWHVGQ